MKMYTHRIDCGLSKSQGNGLDITGIKYHTNQKNKKSHQSQTTAELNFICTYVHVTVLCYVYYLSSVFILIRRKHELRIKTIEIHHTVGSD